MKQNAKKILLFLYKRPTDAYFFATDELIRLAVPDLTPAGQLSLLNLLKKRELIAAETVLGQTRYRVTTAGQNAIKTSLPVLHRSEQSWKGVWVAVVFREAPKGDQQFRYLRSLLVKYQSFPLARGIYIYPDNFPPQVMAEIDARYRSAVSLFEIGKWLSDDERQIAIQHYGLSDLLQAYSGISSEIERLISKKKNNMVLNQQEKTQLSSLFNRIYENMIEDMGLLGAYFPQVKSGFQVLADFQDFCRSITF